MMPRSSSPLLSLLLFLSLYYYTSTLVSCTKSEGEALLAWRSSLKYPGSLTKMWPYNVSTDPCLWDGIKCNRDGSITAVYYDGLNDSVNGTLAKFNFSLFPNLISLEITDNQNLHGEIPEEIGWLHNLEILDLSNNNLTGQIPRAIQNLSNLQGLALSLNHLAGQIPRAIVNLSSIQALALNGNELSGEIPREILKLSNLDTLFLQHNKFTGEIPNIIGHSTKLRLLSLTRNMLSGHIPAEIGNMTALQFINLSYNELEGEVPSTIAQLYHSDLYLDDNKLTGSITPNIGNNETFSAVGLSNNNFIGTVPSSICSGGTLEYFSASNNNFDKLLPNTFQNCTSLERIILGSNNIKADISHVFGEHPNLTYVDFSRNHFYGRLLSSLDGLTTSASTQIKVINLDNNNLMGDIPPSLMHSASLSVLFLSNNFSTIPMVNAPSLRSLHLSNNQLVSEFPLLRRNWTNLIILDLGENNFFGKIPPWIGSSFPVLKILRLRSNQFGGSIPSQMSKLNNLQLLDLSNNNLTGPIPQIFFNMSFMKIRSTSNISYVDKNVSGLYEEKIDVVWKGEDFTFKSTIALLTGIDLSCNSLSGEISEDLMGLQGLDFLNLSRNQLTGVIPYNIGNLTWLEVLDLSINLLSGTIPPSISHLTHLAMLNLSHNKLTGQIPLGSQIQTFNASVFSDNDGLCGSPLPNNCSTRNSLSVAPMNYRGDQKFEVVWIVSSIIFGFIIGFWIYTGALFLKASLRSAIFDLVDKFQGKMLKWCYF